MRFEFEIEKILTVQEVLSIAIKCEVLVSHLYSDSKHHKFMIGNESPEYFTLFFIALGKEIEKKTFSIKMNSIKYKQLSFVTTFFEFLQKLVDRNIITKNQMHLARQIFET